MTTYPVRCQLVVGSEYEGPPRPEDNNPHVGEFGVADFIDDKVVITLDSGVVVQDCDCWWVEAVAQDDEEKD